MENNLIDINLAKVLEESTAKAEQLSALAVITDNCLTLESKRTEANKEIKAYKAKIEEAKKKYLEPFTAIEEQALQAIKPYEEATKAFSASILEAKKYRRDTDLQNYYNELLETSMDEDGALPSWFPSFDKAKEGISYNVTLNVAKQLLRSHIVAEKKDTHNVILRGSQNAIELVKSYALGLQCEWEEL